MTGTGNFTGTDNKKLWEEAYAALPRKLQDVYYTPDYYSVYEKNSGSRAKCFIYRENENIFLYPFLITEIDKKLCASGESWFDIEGAYGYNGPLCNSANEAFIHNAHTAFREQCIQNRVIAEFTRFNPVLKNHLHAGYMTVMLANQNIVLDLSIPDIRMEAYEHSTRKNINKAERSGLTARYVSGQNIPKEEMAAFLEIYYDTMKRNNALGQYYFSEKYFDDLSNSLSDNALFFFTLAENKIVSCELVLKGQETGYSFLGGTLPDYFSLRANDILKHHIILTLKEKGLRYFCLGGGTTPNDGIFKYKKCFAKNGAVDFFIGKKIYNEAAYNSVVENWKMIYPEKEETYKHYLLKYKY
jgi:hypothetical protein